MSDPVKVKAQFTDDDKGPSETLRDEEKLEADGFVLREAGVPGAQNPDSEEIKDEKGPNTE